MSHALNVCNFFASAQRNERLNWEFPGFELGVLTPLAWLYKIILFFGLVESWKVTQDLLKYTGCNGAVGSIALLHLKRLRAKNLNSKFYGDLLETFACLLINCDFSI